MSRRETDATDPAGLRLPVRKRLVPGLALRAYAALASPGAVLRLFRREAELACAIAVGLDEARGRCALRIRRVAGLEPGGRDWSVYMVLDHLVMVNTAVTALVHALCASPGHRVEITSVDATPHLDAGPDRIDALRASVEHHTEVIERLGVLHGRESYPILGSVPSAPVSGAPVSIACRSNASHVVSTDSTAGYRCQPLSPPSPPRPPRPTGSPP
ncbi:DinB family protein [Marichromatium bheemlicum]|uniref:DinB family protein n=1 Tax=Marichromatium bheemlicum TaxID=365339 RepID=UPI001FE7A02E|nr:DinB family protein [Marichromatium bheemlicum]